MTRNSAKLLLAFIAVLGVLGATWRLYRSPERLVRSEAVERRVIALRVLAENIAAQKRGATVLVVANPFVQQAGQPAEVHAFEQAALRGVNQGLGGKVRFVGVAYPKLTAAAASDPTSVLMPPDITTPLSFMTVPNAWHDLRRAYPTADLWVSLIGLPFNVTAMEVWRERSPQFALLLPDLRVLGDANAVMDAFQSEKILAAVLNRPGAPTESTTRVRDYRAEFEQRFLLVTKTNIQAVLDAWPGLF